MTNHTAIKQIAGALLFMGIFLNGKAQELVPFQQDTLWGYKDRQGATIILPQYQYATPFYNNTAIVAKDNKLGAVNPNNELIIPFRYDFLRPLDANDFLFGNRAKYFGEYYLGVITRDEKIIIPPVYSWISKHRNTYKVTKNDDTIIGKANIGDIRSVKSTYGLFDSIGNTLIPCRFNSIRWINDTLLSVDSATHSANGNFLISNHALFSIDGRQLTEFKFMVFGAFIEGAAKARIGNKYGFIYPDGKIVVPIIYDYCENFDCGYAIIKEKDKWGAVDIKGNIVIETQYDYSFVKKTLEEKYYR